MMSSTRNSAYLWLALISLAVLGTGCASTDSRTAGPSCDLTSSHQLEPAFNSVRSWLQRGCSTRMATYMSQLMEIATDDPGPDNRRRFSEFLESLSGEGLISQMEARLWYNRYFNVKFMAIRDNYNTCSAICTLSDSAQERVMKAMEQELLNKEQGLMKVSDDPQAYYRADRLYREAGRVIHATCKACQTQLADNNR